MHTNNPYNTILIRHGDTKMNSSNEERGWSKVNLSDKGKREAEKMAKELQGKDIKRIVSSDLPRAKETAEIIGKKLKVPVAMEKSLRTWNTGKLVGMDSKEVKPILDHLALNRPNEPAPKGESFNQFKKRFVGALPGLLKKGTAIVTHSNGTKLASHFIRNHKVDSKDYVKDTIKPGHFEIIKH